MNELVGHASGLGWTAVKAVLLLLVAIVGLRVGERRTLAQLDAVDFAATVAIGAIIGRGATASAMSFLTGAVALVTLLVVHRGIVELRRRGVLGHLLDRRPLVLVARGRVLEDELARAGLTHGDLYALLRRQGVTDLDATDAVLYEMGGSLSIVPRGHGADPLVREALGVACGRRQVAR